MTGTVTPETTGVAHPLSMLTGAEVTRATEVLRARGNVPEGALFAHMVLKEPAKDVVAAWQPGAPIAPEVRVLVVPGPGVGVIEAVVSVTAGEVREFRAVEGMRSALLMTDAINAIFTTKDHPDYLAALARRGITDLDNVQIDPWPAGVF